MASDVDIQRGEPAPEEPWIETRAGGLFFLSALLVAPALVVLVPLLAGALFRALGLIEGPSRMFDTIPRLARYFAPWVGWLAAPAAWGAWYALRAQERRGPKVWLTIFLGLHVGTVSYVVWRWVGG